MRPLESNRGGFVPSARNSNMAQTTALLESHDFARGLLTAIPTEGEGE